MMDNVRSTAANHRSTILAGGIVVAVFLWLRSDIRQLQSDIVAINQRATPDLSRRLTAVEANRDGLQSTFEKLQAAADAAKQDHDLLIEISKRVDGMTHQAARPVFEIKPPEINIQTPHEIQTPREVPAERPRRSADLIVTFVRVKPTKANGKAWDVGQGAPDIFVEVTAGNRSAQTTTKQDTFEATFNEKVIRVQEGDTLKITVVDKDILANDTIGVYTKEITASTLDEKTADWSFGQVESLQVKFEP